MNKYNVFLTDSYNSSSPFIADWDYELIGDVFRAEFDEYYKEQEKLAGAGAGKSKQLFKGEVVKKFMIRKRINLVDDPSNGNLKSVFVLRPGEKKLIDGRAKASLASRFEYKEKIGLDGMVVAKEGFMKFDLVEGVEKEDANGFKELQVEGNDIEYFQEEAKIEPEIEVEVKIEDKKEFVCPNCDKEFDSGRALNGHKLSCKSK
jgi:hypothetical protein